jgi:hypothetical protein
MIGRSICWAACLGMLGMLLVTMGGCATVCRGSNQKIKMVTDPPGATLNVDGKPYTTPTTVVLKRNKPHVVTITKEGYEGLTFKLRAGWDAGGAGAVLADIVIPGGTVLFAIDTLVGADRQFNQMATIKMTRARGPTTAPVLVFEHKGRLLTKAAYDQAVARDSFFATKPPTDKTGAEPSSPPAEASPTSTMAQKPAAPPAPSAPAQSPSAGASAAPEISD